MKAMEHMHPNFGTPAFVVLVLLKIFEWLGKIDIGPYASIATLISCTLVAVANLPKAMEVIRNIKNIFKKKP